MLNIADKLKLPVDAATQTFAFIARKGAGKTYAAGKLVELLLDASDCERRALRMTRKPTPAQSITIAKPKPIPRSTESWVEARKERSRCSRSLTPSLRGRPAVANDDVPGGNL